MTLAVAEIEQAATPFDRDPRADSDDRDAWRAYRGNRGFASAWRKGALSAAEGKTLRDCPYPDERTDRGGVTFSRAFIRAWCEGWHFATFDGRAHVCKLQSWHDGPCKVRA